jgi:hypothetical protein
MLMRRMGRLIINRLTFFIRNLVFNLLLCIYNIIITHLILREILLRNNFMLFYWFLDLLRSWLGVDHAIEYIFMRRFTFLRLQWLLRSFWKHRGSVWNVISSILAWNICILYCLFLYRLTNIIISLKFCLMLIVNHLNLILFVNRLGIIFIFMRSVFFFHDQLIRLYFMVVWSDSIVDIAFYWLLTLFSARFAVIIHVFTQLSVSLHLHFDSV